MTFLMTDAGRSTSKRPRSKNDCTVRAVALAFGLKFDEAYELLAQEGRKAHQGMPFKKWANSHPKLQWISFPAVKGKFPVGKYILREAAHVSVVIDGVVMDTMPPYPGRCIYGCWEVK